MPALLLYAITSFFEHASKKVGENRAQWRLRRVFLLYSAHPRYRNFNITFIILEIYIKFIQNLLKILNTRVFRLEGCGFDGDRKMQEALTRKARRLKSRKVSELTTSDCINLKVELPATKQRSTLFAVH